MAEVAGKQNPIDNDVQRRHGIIGGVCFLKENRRETQGERI
jgi:hypothetical protein